MLQAQFFHPFYFRNILHDDHVSYVLNRRYAAEKHLVTVVQFLRRRPCITFDKQGDENL
jgi:hypothetical protein